MLHTIYHRFNGDNSHTRLKIVAELDFGASFSSVSLLIETSDSTPTLTLDSHRRFVVAHISYCKEFMVHDEVLYRSIVHTVCNTM